MNPEKLKQKGNRALAGRQPAKAEKSFRRLLALDQASVPAYRGLSVALSRQDRYSEVVELLRPVVQTLESPSLWLCLADASSVLVHRGERQRVDEALAAFEQYNLTVREPLSLYNRAQILQKFKRDYEAALELYLEAWRLKPGDRYPYMAALHCLRQLGRVAETDALKEEWRLHKER